MGLVHHLAIERKHAGAGPGGEAVAHSPRPGDLLLARREGGVDGSDLRRVDAELAREPVLRRGGSLAGEAVRVARVWPGRVEGRDARRRGAQERRGARGSDWGGVGA